MLGFGVCRRNGKPDEVTYLYQEKVAAVGDFVRKPVPRTAGAGNSQGRKPK